MHAHHCSDGRIFLATHMSIIVPHVLGSFNTEIVMAISKHCKACASDARYLAYICYNVMQALQPHAQVRVQFLRQVVVYSWLHTYTWLGCHSNRPADLSKAFVMSKQSTVPCQDYETLVSF